MESGPAHTDAMLTLSLVRHAKSSWDSPDLSDFERPLNERGRRDAPQMALRLREAGLQPDRLLSSPALRAISTARIFAEQLGIALDEIQLDSRIYDASLATLIEVLRGSSAGATHLMMFGHNPGFSDLVSLLSEPFEELPTCAVVVLDLDLRRWSAVGPRCGRVRQYLYPKDGH